MFMSRLEIFLKFILIKAIIDTKVVRSDGERVANDRSLVISSLSLHDRDHDEEMLFSQWKRWSYFSEDQ